MNKCNCGKALTRICCNKKCIVCCNNKNCEIHNIIKRIKVYTQKELNEIKFIFHKTVIPNEIVDYIVDEYINKFKHCKLCNNKHENLVRCDCCEEQFCNKCVIDNKTKFRNNIFCRKCNTNLHKEYICNDCNYYHKRSISCKRCNNTVCVYCNNLDYCFNCFTIIKDDLILTQEQLENNYFRCDNCNCIERYPNTCECCYNGVLCDNCIYYKNINDNCYKYCHNCTNLTCEFCINCNDCTEHNDCNENN